jgi:hypothetical protein
MTEITLTRPISAHGEQRMVLTLREPTGGDLIACGVPTTTSGPEFGKWAGAMLSRLAEVPPSSIAALSAPDFMRALPVLLGFLGAPTPPPSSSAT